MCYILSTTKNARGGDSAPFVLGAGGPGQGPGENSLVLNFRYVVCAHGFVHGFAHGFGV